MERNRLCLFITFIGMGVSQCEEGASAELSNSYSFYTTSGKELVWRYGQHNQLTSRQNRTVKRKETEQGMFYRIIRKGTFSGEGIYEDNKDHNRPISVSTNGKTCVLFGTKRIMIRFNNETQLDLATKNVSLFSTVDLEKSSCKEENAILSLKFSNIGILEGLALRFLLMKSYYKLSLENWFKLHSVQIFLNNSVQATFNTTDISAPISYSYHCQHVSSLRKYDPLLFPSSADNKSKQWDVTFLHFQLQAFNVEEEHFGHVKECVPHFSPAILMGLVMSLILLLVLAYALHMLIHLKSIDRHYQRKHSTPSYPQTKAYSVQDESESISSRLQECYELRQQQYCARHTQQCSSGSY